MKNPASNRTLSELKEGAVEELYARALGLVLEDIMDPNTAAEAKRKIVVEVTLTPSANRSFAAVDINVTTKLPGPNPVQTSFSLKTEQGALVAHEPIQDKLFADSSAN